MTLRGLQWIPSVGRQFSFIVGDIIGLEPFTRLKFAKYRKSNSKNRRRRWARLGMGEGGHATLALVALYSSPRNQVK